MVWAFRFLKDVFLMVRSFLFEQSPVNQILLLLECVCVCVCVRSLSSLRTLKS